MIPNEIQQVADAVETASIAIKKASEVIKSTRVFIMEVDSPARKNTCCLYDIQQAAYHACTASNLLHKVEDVVNEINRADKSNE